MLGEDAPPVAGGRLYFALLLSPTRGWGPQKKAMPSGTVAMVVSAEPSTATNISN
jgi:hypothetical protein